VLAQRVVDAGEGVQAVGDVLRLRLLQLAPQALQQCIKQGGLVVPQAGKGPQRVAAVDGAEAVHLLQHLGGVVGCV
jgi:shikimate kinase